MQQYQDDLKHASDAIAKIAFEAIASIERLYGNRNGLNSLQKSPTVEVPQFPVIPDFTESEPQEDLVLPPTKKPTAKPAKAPTFETIERPPLIDSDLEKMLL